MSDEKTKSKKGRSQNVMVTEQDLPAVQGDLEVLIPTEDLYLYEKSLQYKFHQNLYHHTFQ